MPREIPCRDSALVRKVLALLLAAVPLSARADDDAQREAQRIFAATGVQGGLVVHLGCGDGRLTAALGAGHGFLVHGLDADAAHVAAARKFLDERGCPGTVSVDRLTGNRLPYVDNLVNLLVAESLEPIGKEEVLRVLAPRGAACLKRGDQWEVLRKPWPDDIDEWTHWLHGPDGNGVARDRQAGPPRHVQWLAGPQWQRHHETVPSVSAMVSSAGRLFAIQDLAPPGIDGLPDQWHLVARDAFNGVLLWKTPIAEWGWSAWSDRSLSRFNQPTHLPRRLVAAGDRLYVTLGFNAPISALDAADGRELQRYAGTESADEILLDQGLLIASLSEGRQGPGRPGQRPADPKTILALRPDTGQVVWQRSGFQGACSKADAVAHSSHLTLVSGGQGLFCVTAENIVGLDRQTGRTLWQTPRPAAEYFVTLFNYEFPNLCSLVYHDGLVLFAQPEIPSPRQVWNEPAKSLLLGLDAGTGEVLWRQACGAWGHYNPGDLFVIGGLVWVHSLDNFELLGLEPRSGQIQRRFSEAEALDQAHHHRCYQNKATERFVLTARRGIECLDLAAGQCHVQHWVRGTCRFGILPCNGLIYAPPHPCICYLTAKLNGFYALAPERPEPPSGDPAARWEKGPAFADKDTDGQRGKGSEGQGDADWPMFRHDPRRSGAAGTSLPEALELAWHVPAGGTVSPPVVAGGRVYAALVDEHRVLCLDAQDGRRCWSFTAGGRIDTPPAVAEGRVLFGSADGWAYCLQAADGRLIWRYRAAPADLRLVDHGQIASAWPLSGSLLIQEDRLLLAAGRSSFLDGGIVLAGLDPATGRLLAERRLYSPDPDSGEMLNGRLPYDMPEEAPGVLPDVLVADGPQVCMRQYRFDPQTLDEVQAAAAPKTRAGEQPGLGPQLMAGGGLLDPSWFNQTYWTVDGRAHAKLLVFDDDTAYGITPQRDAKRHSRAIFRPGTKGYTLFAHDRARDKDRWSRQVPLRITALALAGPILWAAGTPDVVDDADPWATLEGRRGGRLWAVRAADGVTLAEYPVDAAPVFDGLAAAGARLYLATTDGSVLCWKGK